MVCVQVTHVLPLLIIGAITVPARHTQDGDGVKKPVKYGTRFRGKQKKDTSSHTNEEEMPVVETATGTTQQLNNKRETNSIPEGATGEEPIIGIQWNLPITDIFGTQNCP